MPKAPDGPLLPSRGRPQRDGKLARERRPMVPVIGIESEFTLYVQDEKRLPEHVFRNPQEIIRERMIPRSGHSYHLPSGGALYFDTGVIEVATPIIELEPGCCVRAVRSLWEQIAYLRGELDEWERQHNAAVRLEGFSTHYNISIPSEIGGDPARMQRLGILLTHLLHAPMMLLAANKLSTGIGVRPRDHRLEVTADFTPDPNLMVAAATLVVGTVLAVIDWQDHSLTELERRGFPVIAGFHHRKHTSRKGYLARFDCFPQNPFAADPNEPLWALTDSRKQSLREVAFALARPFRRAMRTVGDAATLRHLFAVLGGRARSLLDFPDRPRRYEDVGRIIDWDRRAMIERLPRSKYEQVIHRIITHRAIRVGRFSYRPERMRGWYEIVFRNTRTGHRRVFNLDDLVRHCAV